MSHREAVTSGTTTFSELPEITVIPTASRRRRRRSQLSTGQADRIRSVAFMVVGTTGEHPAPAFQQLLRGVTDAARDARLSLTLSFVSDPAQVPAHLAARRLDGVLLHGEKPTHSLEKYLQNTPCVWLMANRHRPGFGDQIMPNNTGIGVMAAQYLLGRGHRRLAYLSCGQGSWFMGVRWLTFAAAAADAGASAFSIEETEERCQDLWQQDRVAAAADRLVRRLLEQRPMPTGLFVAEDRLLPVIDAAMVRHGSDLGALSGLDVVSCNNERPHLMGLRVAPATIDIHVESIGRRAVEQLIWRMRNGLSPERVRMMIEPTLVPPHRPEVDQTFPAVCDVPASMVG
jgi:DNA-binding LacI/PurR family transcriptional regulator